MPESEWFYDSFVTICAKITYIQNERRFLLFSGVFPRPPERCPKPQGRYFILIEIFVETNLEYVGLEYFHISSKND
jgi:hypothetical protein